MADGVTVKPGITSTLSRLNKHQARGYLPVALWHDQERGIVQEVERAVLRGLRLAGFEPLFGKEYFDRSATGLILETASRLLNSSFR
jgi:hypothetical protein